MDATERTAAIRVQRQPANRPAEQLWIADAWRSFEVWRVPLDLLVLNVENRRFAAERKYFEAKLGGLTLDPENRELDALSLESILLDSIASRRIENGRVVGKPSKDTVALEADWLSRGQERPFWIRPDGVAHNGNRRLAIMRRRRRRYGEDGNTWVEVVEIGDDIDELTLFRMEQHEQLTEDYKVRYTDINLLLAIRDAAEASAIDWGDADSIDRVAGELRGLIGNNKNYAVTQLYAIKYMDAFLDDLNQAEAYELLLRQIERFRDVGKAMRQVQRLAPDREEDMLDVCFAAIRSGIPHGDIRDIRKMFVNDRSRFDALVAEIREAEAGWEPAPGTQPLHEPDLRDAVEDEPDVIDDPDEDDEPDVVDDPDEDDDADSEPPGPNMPDYEPAANVRRSFDSQLDGFKASQGTDVLKLLAEVVNRLEALASENRNLLEDARAAGVAGIDDELARIVTWVDEYTDHLK